MVTINPGRRAALALLAALPLPDAAAAPAAQPGTRTAERTVARKLVVYFSRSGNTRVIAGVIQRKEHADVFEIVPANAYPDDYFETVEQARQQRDRGDQPPLIGQVADSAAYGTVFLGFPIWGETLPPPVRTFVATQDWNGKVLVPFITHGGYGTGDSLAELAKRTGGARLRPALVIEADQERRTTNLVQGWLNDGAKGRG